MRHPVNIKRLSAAICCVFWASGCTQSISNGLPTMVPTPTSPASVLPTSLPSGFPAVTQANAPKTATPANITALTAPVNTPVPPAGGSVVVTAAPLPSPPAASAQQTTLDRNRVKIFLVAPNDNGKSGPKIGCNDSLIGVERELKQPTQAVLTASLNELFSIKTQTAGQSGLINALYQSNMQLKSAQVVNGRMVVQLSGTPKYGGTCDVPRFKEQISATVRQFPTTTNAIIYVNDVLIENLK
ncbi:MAG: hypothetical protein KIH69_013185 [Anaerolineae bacterium]|nr:hypothetical protein [Anaerolineae bacterium]